MKLLYTIYHATIILCVVSYITLCQLITSLIIIFEENVWLPSRTKSSREADV